MRKICCGVVIYNPNQKEIENILKYKEVFEDLIIFDNSDFSTKKIEFPKDIVVLNKNGNQGLAKAYNIMCGWAINHNYDLICIFDQDSIMSSMELKTMFEAIDKVNLDSVAVISPNTAFDHQNYSISIDNESEIEEVEWTISSGSFLNLEIYAQNGPFDENFFIDRIDIDYCYTMRSKNKKILKVNSVQMNQTLGETKKILFWNIKQYSSIRHYYSFRNRLYYYLKKHKKIKKSKWLTFKGSILQITQIILMENDKLNKLKMLWKASKDYRNNRMGKIQEEY